MHGGGGNIVWENQSHFDDYPEKGKSLIDITRERGRISKTGGSGGFWLLTQITYCSVAAVFQRLEMGKEEEEERMDFCLSEDIIQR